MKRDAPPRSLSRVESRPSASAVTLGIVSDDNQNAALRAAQEEARDGGDGSESPSPVSQALASSVVNVVLGACACLLVVLLYLWLTDPCFDFKMDVTLNGDDPSRVKVWQMECSTTSGECVCETPTEGYGCQEFCMAEEGSLDLRCGLECTDPAGGW